MEFPGCKKERNSDADWMRWKAFVRSAVPHG
jgi:hypothetical protein